MKQKIPTILPYNSKNSDSINKYQLPLSSRLTYYSDLYTSSSINRQEKSKRSQFYPNSTINSKTNSYLKNINIKKKLSYVFKDPKEKYKKKFVWPKITHPKLPFSERNTISPEEKKRRIMEKKPSHLYHDFYTIKWLRQKYSDSLIEKSVFSMLPDNGKSVIPDDESEEDKKHRLLMEYLENLYKREPEHEKFVNIHPKYFFDKSTFEKILKFKAIFLEFDEDQSRKMELDEMVEMFNQNHIKATTKELVNLFFKGKKFREEDIMKLYLDFYQFMNFALTKDQDFREFMREIKLKREKDNDGFNSEKSDEEKNGYLPMNFNLMFDYFLIKGKERASIEAIENGIEEMDKIINNKDEEEKGEEVNELNLDVDKKLNLALKHSNSVRSNKNKDEEENNENSKYYDEQLKNLNFCELIQNFSNLFAFHDQAGNFNEPKREVSLNNAENLSSNSSKTKNSQEGNETKIKKIINKINISNKNKINDNKGLNEKEYSMKEFLRNQMNRKMIKNLNIKNFRKYHNIKLALSATKRQVNSFIKSYGNNVNEIYKIPMNNKYDKSKTNNKELPTLSFYSKKTFSNNQSHYNREKKLFKTKTHSLFNQKNKNKKISFDKRRKLFSLRTEGKINYINDIQYWIRNDYNSIFTTSSYERRDFKTEMNNNKFDYVPPEFLKIKNNNY